ncbi:condensin subunit Smc [Ectothiorhodosinus mongolicus]|uniref:Chromosome partition protein Smc n=1 Tax=Ectothiorhodosinus mongolicus TaxID=233100 RepID=A0A1R3W5B9_9GAMM|nr:chromosome segregation protein SMC [Ectothiorhodosinus mongolicus]ULX57591.1 chromosome segregation protein SMC [Ectothiorhodosinus mongolicus]SIT72971.1 condensin subunit Smc [Ectothiorhodosinus mongolicus]
MRLSRIKLAGFKSFVDPTTLDLPSNLVGIVGPNGCGKSNTIDAVRWVMGESSAKHLRGDSMEDVIFSGSSSRKPVGQASIELVFDNSSGKLGGAYAQYAEIAVKRRVSRDGQSQYFLNGARCRRRDITDIFLGTGLGPRSYAIIEQGMISRLIEARPEDLRIYLEEAAGISKYRERRRETENRIRHARENLERLEDVREEVAKQLRHLEKQAEVADKYKKLREEERQAKGELLVLRLKALQEEAARREAEVNEQTLALEQAIAEQRHVEAGLESQRQSLSQANETLNMVQGHYYKLGADISATEQSIRMQTELSARRTQEREEARASLSSIDAHLQEDQQRLESLSQELAKLQPEQEQHFQRLEAVKAALQSAEEAMAAWQQRWDVFTQQAAEPAQTAQVQGARMEYLERQLQSLKQRNERLSQEAQTLGQGDLEPAIYERQQALKAAQAEHQKAESKLQAAGELVAQRRDEQQQKTQALEEQRRELQVSQGRLSSLEALQQAALGKETGALGSWLQAKQLDGAARLGETLDVESGWESAVETVLGPYLEALCVDQLGDALSADPDALPEANVTLLLAGQSKDSASSPAHSLAAKVRSPHRLSHLLAGIRCVDSLAEAMGWQGRLGAGESVITPQGIWLGQHWVRITRQKDSRSGTLAREKEIRSLKTHIQQLQAKVEQGQDELDQNRAQQQQAEQDVEAQQNAVNTHYRQVSELSSELQSLKARSEQLRSRRSQIEAEQAELAEQRAQETQALKSATSERNTALTLMEQFSLERSQLESEREQLRTELNQQRQVMQAQRDRQHEVALRIQSLQTGMQGTEAGIGRMQAQREQLQGQLERLEAAILEAGEPLQDLQAQLQEQVAARAGMEDELLAARQGVETLEGQLREADQKRLQLEQQASTIRSRADEKRMAWQEVNVRHQTGREQLLEMALDYDTLLEGLEASASADEWQARVDGLAQRIQRLGPINLAAIDEFKEHSERKAYLDAQHDDLISALETLEQAIARIDRETRSRFQETFDLVNTQLGEKFPRLFGGGHAHLEMTGDDLLTTGVAVMARPPGKRLTTIHLMSGGEKALTAVAMVFAIFELNPAPFCMLDEVDAPLDEANVGRFCALVKDMSQSVQFIYITHNKTTMEMADQLIGVTMREPGVSRLVTVDVDEAAKMATA